MSVHTRAGLDRISRSARREFPHALMSDTKWRKLFRAVESAELGVSVMVVKFIDVAEPRVMRFPPSLNAPYAYMDTIEFGPVELRAIQWLDLPIDVEPVVAPIGKFPLEPTNGGTRIVGYRS
jgi:hypothetical protein